LALPSAKGKIEMSKTYAESHSAHVRLAAETIVGTTETKTLFGNGSVMTLVTFRKTGKAHRGVFWKTPRFPNGYLNAVCGCPGSANGRLTSGAQIVCEGHARSNCGN